MKNKYFSAFLIKHSRPLILILIFLFFSCFTNTFWSLGNWGNFANIILQQAPFSVLLAISMTLVIILNGFDLSIGASVALISCICGMILRATYNPWLAIVAALLLGCAVGLINGLLVAKLKVSSFVATYSMQWILQGVAYVLLGGSQIYDFGPSFRPLFISNPWTFFILAGVIAVLVWFLLSRTVFGRQLYATGTNECAARISGIKTSKITILVFMLSGMLVGLTTVMYIANLGTAEPAIGENFALNAIAATLIGGTAIGGGSGSVSNALVGALIMLFLSNGMIQSGVPSVWQQFIVGGVIIFSIVLERSLQKLSQKMA
ncbi:ABC transporter permease [Caproiciproducens sp.]